ncbi:MAG: PadR family transcriptional regulator [Clostridia bacterium]|nr:PadR family transcriptional regulator [Clostridia bacterium]
MEKDNFNANVDFVRGQADMIVLSALSDTDKYGLEILSAIQERSQGMYSLKQATLYSSLKRLEKNGYVHSYDGDISNGAKRVYYGLTQMGREHLENDKSYWEFCNFLMSNLISDNKFDPQSEDKPFDPAEFRPLTRRARGEKEDKDQEKEKEVVVKYVYLKSDDIPEGADIVYVSPENIEEINNANAESTENSESVEIAEVNSDLAEEDSAQEPEDTVTEIENQEITSLSNSGEEYQPSFILIDEEETTVDDEVATIEENEVAEVESVEEDATPSTTQEQESELQEEPQNEDSAEIEQYTESVVESDSVISSEEASESEPEEALVNEEENINQETESLVEETSTSSFASRPLRNPTLDSSTSFSSIFSNYSRENDVNYVESFSELFDVEDEDDSLEQETTDIEFLTMKEMVYKYQAKGVNIKPYDKRNTMEYYVNRYYFSNKLQFHASLIIFAIFAVELFIAHFICNRGENKISDLWLLMIFVLAIFPAIRSVMYVIDPTRKSLANYNPKTSFLISLLPVVTLPIVFALMGFVEFGANINDYMSMERTIILPSVLLFNIPLFSIIYTLLYRTYKYHVN